jgi:tetratricopeptide (TPR) repeat protein
MRAYFFEGRERLEQLLAQQGAAPRTLLRASALAGAGQMAAALGDIGAANRSSVEAIDIAREHGRAGWPVLAGVLARQPFYFMLEASAEAERGLEEAWAIAHELGDSWLMGGVLQRRAFWYMAQDNRAVARMTMEESLRYFRVAGDRRRETIVLRDIGRMLFLDRDIEGSRRHYEQSLSYFREALDRRNISISLNMLGEIERLAENDEAAKLYYVEALALARESGDQMRIPLYTANLAFVYLHLGDLARAEEQFGEALQQDHLRNAQESLDGDLQGFAGLAAAKRQPIRAAKLFGATERLTEALGQRLVMWSNPADEAERARNVELARAQLDEATFSAAWAEGRALTLEQAIALALGDG